MGTWIRVRVMIIVQLTSLTNQIILHEAEIHIFESLPNIVGVIYCAVFSIDHEISLLIYVGR